MNDGPRSTNPYESPKHGQDRPLSRRFTGRLATLCAIRSPLLLVLTWAAVYLLLSVGLFHRLDPYDETAYKLVGRVGAICGLAGIGATILALVYGSRFERFVMAIICIPYAPLFIRFLTALGRLVLQ
jgi:hypothetical protein